MITMVPKDLPAKLNELISMAPQDMTSTLKSLIETSKDSEYKLRAGAERTQCAVLRQTYVCAANDCLRAARELQIQITQLGEEVALIGSTSGAVNRGWAWLRGALVGNSDEAILKECGTELDLAIQRYEDALDELLPANVRNVLDRHVQDFLHNRTQLVQKQDPLNSTENNSQFAM